jgi:hypothetical protein
MGNGQWGSGGLQGPVQRSEHTACSVGSLEYRYDAGLWCKANTLREFQVGFEFLEAALRYPEMMDVVPTIVPAIAFSNIGRNRGGSTTNLARHAKDLFMWECSGNGVAHLRYGHSFLPYIQISVRLNRAANTLRSVRPFFPIAHCPLHGRV